MIITRRALQLAKNSITLSSPSVNGSAIGEEAVFRYNKRMAKRTHTSKKKVPTKRVIANTLIAATFVVSSFFLGIRTSGDVDPIHTTEAGSTSLRSDLSGDGVVTAEDAIVALEIAKGYIDAQPWQLLVDPNGDSIITVDDAILILKSL